MSRANEQSSELGQVRMRRRTTAINDYRTELRSYLCLHLGLCTGVSTVMPIEFMSYAGLFAT